MPGATFTPGVIPIRPGPYVAIANVGQTPGPAQGIVAALFRASWGPLTPTVLNSYDAVAATYGLPVASTSTVDVAQQAFLGGAQQVLAYRLGTGGSPAAATKVLLDTAGSPVSVVTITAKYQGVRGNTLGLLVRTNLLDSTKRDLVVLEGSTIRQTFTYTPGSNEAAAVVAAVAAAGSVWITAAKITDTTFPLANLSTPTLLTGGVDPTVSGADMATALLGIEGSPWQTLATENETNAIQVTNAAYIDRVRQQDGRYAIGVVGEPTSISQATRFADAVAFNNPWIVYVANGFVKADGTTIEGYKAAARVAGMIASAPLGGSLTHAIVSDGVSVNGGMTGSDIINAIQNGALVFSLNASNQVQIEYGVTTLTTAPLYLDLGWKSIRRTRTRDYLITAIVAVLDPLIGQVVNDAPGQQAVVAAAQRVVDTMINQRLLSAGTVAVDAQNPPAGDTLYLTCTVTDTDTVSKILLSFGFAF